MPMPQSYSFTRYLSAKRSVDERAFNQHVWQCLLSWLETAPQPKPMRILELGAGIGSMVERLLSTEGLAAAVYTAIDADPNTTAQAQSHAPRWAAEAGFRVTETATGVRLQRDWQNIEIRLETINLFDFIAREREQQSWELLVAHALIDLLDVPTALPLLLSVLSPGGLFYFPITFDGASILEPGIDPPYDEHIEALYHQTMDERIVRGKPSGDSRTGRHLFAHMRALGANVLAAGSSDWVVFAGPEGYPADEAYFLHHIIDTMHTALATHPQLEPERFERWIHQRHAQIEDGRLVYIAHQLDILGQIPSPLDIS
jgi:SAM-dependent methyltransferase